MSHLNERKVNLKYGCWCVNTENKNVGLRCKHIAHTQTNVACKRSTLNLKYGCWFVNAQCWIIDVEYWIVKTSINSKQQCCKQKVEFWRGYNAIMPQTLTKFKCGWKIHFSRVTKLIVLQKTMCGWNSKWTCNRKRLQSPSFFLYLVIQPSKTFLFQKLQEWGEKGRCLITSICETDSILLTKKQRLPFAIQ